MNKEESQKIHLVLFSGLLLFLTINLVVVANASSTLSEQRAAAEEAARPADLELVTLLSGSCDACDVQATAALDQAKSGTIIKKETTLNLVMDAAAVNSYIERYGIERLPAIIATGETERASLTGFAENEDARVFQAGGFPHVTSEGETVGLVDVTILTDESCDVCADVTNLLSSLQGAGLALAPAEMVSRTSTRGAALIREHGLTKAPALLLSGGIDDYSDIKTALTEIGRDSRGTIVIEEGVVPYVELATDNVRGLVDVIYLDDISCEECYDVIIHKQVLSRFGLAIDGEVTIDAGDTDGKALIAQYGITKVPTLILSSEASRYPVLMQAWTSVGTVEEDGTLIFRSADAMGTYNDLETGEVMAK